MSVAVWLIGLFVVIAIAQRAGRAREGGVLSGGVSVGAARGAAVAQMNHHARALGAAIMAGAIVGALGCVMVRDGLGVPLGPAWVSLSWLAGAASGAWALKALRGGASSRALFERIVLSAMGLVAGLAVLVTFSIFLTLIFETLRFFEKAPPLDFLFGTVWSPQTAIRDDQTASVGAFGVLPLLSGTLLITGIALLVAGPIGLMAAIYMETYASPRLRDGLKLILEILAGVPTVVYGFFALLFVGPLVAKIASSVALAFGAELDVSTQNALGAGLVMGVMIIPFVSSLSDDVISAIPRTLKEGALALGATKSETVLTVLLPAAAPGLVGAFLLAISRAVGETMIVVMAASRSANLTFNPLERVSTITVQIVALLTGDQEFDAAKTLAAFALGLVLFLFTLALNVIALITVKRFKLRYE